MSVMMMAISLVQPQSEVHALHLDLIDVTIETHLRSLVLILTQANATPRGVFRALYISIIEHLLQIMYFTFEFVKRKLG